MITQRRLSLLSAESNRKGYICEARFADLSDTVTELQSNLMEEVQKGSTASEARFSERVTYLEQTLEALEKLCSSHMTAARESLSEYAKGTDRILSSLVILPFGWFCPARFAFAPLLVFFPKPLAKRGVVFTLKTFERATCEF